MIKQKGTQQWFFEELKAINKMKFEFLEKTEPLSYVADLAMRMHTYPIGELLEAPYFMEFYEEKVNLIPHYIVDKKVHRLAKCRQLHHDIERQAIRGTTGLSGAILQHSVLGSIHTKRIHGLNAKSISPPIGLKKSLGLANTKHFHTKKYRSPSN